MKPVLASAWILRDVLEIKLWLAIRNKSKENPFHTATIYILQSKNNLGLRLITPDANTKEPTPPPSSKSTWLSRKTAFFFSKLQTVATPNEFGTNPYNSLLSRSGCNHLLLKSLEDSIGSPSGPHRCLTTSPIPIASKKSFIVSGLSSIALSSTDSVWNCQETFSKLLYWHCFLICTTSHKTLKSYHLSL